MLDNIMEMISNNPKNTAVVITVVICIILISVGASQITNAKKANQPAPASANAMIAIGALVLIISFLIWACSGNDMSCFAIFAGYSLFSN